MKPLTLDSVFLSQDVKVLGLTLHGDMGIKDKHKAHFGSHDLVEVDAELGAKIFSGKYHGMHFKSNWSNAHNAFRISGGQSLLFRTLV